MIMRYMVVILSIGLLFMEGVSSSADTVYLKSGKKIEGEITASSDKNVMVRDNSGEYKTIPANTIVKITKGESTEEEGPPATINTPTILASFSNDRGDITIRYPREWFVREERYRNPYALFFSREKIERDEDIFRSGVTIFKFYHQSWYLKLDKGSVAASLRRCLDLYNGNVSFPNMKTGPRKEISIQGEEALMEEMVFDAPAGYRNKLYIIYAIKDDVLVNLIYEAPEEDFEKLRQAFDESIKTVCPFSPEDRPADTVLLDKEIDNSILNGINIVSANPKRASELFAGSIAMNPAYAKARFIMGSFLMQSARGMGGEEQKKVLETAVHELTLAIDLYNMYPHDYTDFDRSFNISQSYFLLGEIYYFPYNNKKEARKMYEMALEYYAHPGARDALKERFKK